MFKTLKERRDITGENKRPQSVTFMHFQCQLCLLNNRHIFHFWCSWRKHRIYTNQHCCKGKAFLWRSKHSVGLLCMTLWLSALMANHRAVPHSSHLVVNLTFDWELRTWPLQVCYNQGILCSQNAVGQPVAFFFVVIIIIMRIPNVTFWAKFEGISHSLLLTVPHG